jgi:hypothetical protein
MRKITATAAFAAAGVAVLGAAASPATAQNAGVTAGEPSHGNVDASSRADWQICGQSVQTQFVNQDCDNRDHIGLDPQSQVTAGDASVVNADASSRAHWQICGQDVQTQSIGQDCDNRDHVSEGNGRGHHHGHGKGANRGDH